MNTNESSNSEPILYSEPPAQPSISTSTRREFLKTTGKAAAVSALAGVILPQVHAAEGNSLQIALVGCGGRGTGAAGNALSTIKKGPVTLNAMVDVFERRLDTSYKTIKKEF